MLSMSSNHAFVTGPNGIGVSDLSAAIQLPGGAQISRVLDLNNHGQILVAAPLPEREMYAMLLMGLSIVTFIACRRKQIS